MEVVEAISPLRLVFRVHDTGVGISAAVRAQLFEPFARAATTRWPGGSGLSLAISQRTVALMGGALAVESEEGVGSRFTFDVLVDPIKPSSTPTSVLDVESPVAPTVPPLPAFSHQVRRHVLLVDDDAVHRAVIAAMLVRLKCAVATVTNGVEAVRAVQTESYDLVFMDVEMPEMDGLVATAELRSRGLAVRIIAMTAGTSPLDRERCLVAGMDDYLAKPARLADLRSCIARWAPL